MLAGNWRVPLSRNYTIMTPEERGWGVGGETVKGSRADKDWISLSGGGVLGTVYNIAIVT